MKEQKNKKAKKDKEKENLKEEANQNISLLQSQIEDLSQKLNALLDSQGNDQGEENDQNDNNNQEGNEHVDGQNEPNEGENNDNQAENNALLNPEVDEQGEGQAGNNNQEGNEFVEDQNEQSVGENIDNQAESDGQEEGNEEIEIDKKRKEKIDEYLEKIDNLRKEKGQYEAFLNNNGADEDLLDEGIDLAAIDESINDLELKLEEYKKMISKVNEIDTKIKEINDIINSNNKKIKLLEKKLSQKEKDLSEAIKKYEKNKSLNEKELNKKKEIDITQTIMKDKELNIKNLKDETSSLRQVFKNHQDKIKMFLDSKNNKNYRDINAALVIPSDLFENIQRKCKEFFFKEYNEFSKMYSK